MIFKNVILIEEAVGGDANSSRDYTKFNLCQPNGNLADVPENYKYSSAIFYETGIKNFDFLTHFNDF